MSEKNVNRFLMRCKPLRSKPVYALLMLITITVLSILITTKVETSDMVRLSVRSVGHELLRSNDDLHSVVPPVIQHKDQFFTLKFAGPLVLKPDTLAASALRHLGPEVVERAFVKVIEDGTIVYEFKVDHKEGHVIPCLGRDLERSVYTLEVHPQTNQYAFSSVGIAGVSVSVIVLVGFMFSRTRGSQAKSFPHMDVKNRLLIYRSDRVKLTEKEMEILQELLKKPGELILREELLHKVWYDKGVITGRSLDTYISRLRKKTNKVAPLEIINEHGKGYRLVWNQ